MGRKTKRRAHLTGLLLSTVIMSSALFSSGCASSAKGLSQSAAAKYSAPQTLTAIAPKGTPLAVIRYPAYVESAAADEYYAAFTRASIGGYAGSGTDSAEAQALADSVILKSNYFALSLFKELAAKLPEHGVLLSPHAVSLDAQGQLTSTPMTQAESLPNVVTIDFASYTFPNSEKMMGKEPLTFGDIITPLVSVNTDHRASAATQGLLLASDPILRRAAGNGQDDALTAIDAMQSGRLTPLVAELDFISHLRGNEALTISAQDLSRLAPDNTAQIYPLEKLELNMSGFSGSAGGQISDPLSAAFSKNFANRIVGLINSTDIDKATMAGRAAAIAQFDESLAALTLIGSEDADYLSRLRYAERLLEAEQKYLSVQSLRLFDGIYNGEMGAQVRDMITSEYEVLEERRSLARKQNTATAFAVLSAIAAVSSISNQSGSSNGPCDNAQTDREYRQCQQREAAQERQACARARTRQEYEQCVRRYRQSRQSSSGNADLSKVLIGGSIFAAQQAYSMNQQSKTISANFRNAITPAIDEQISVQVDLIDSNETITAIRFEDLRAKLQTLYSSKQRALDTVATRCAFGTASAPRSGTWMGVCDGGLANGAGVGILTQSDGTKIEYYGYAKDGLAEGAGYKITHTGSSSSAIEGNFANGFANGIMRVSKAGAPDALRQFANDRDNGAAPIGQSYASPFRKDDPVTPPIPAFSGAR